MQTSGPIGVFSGRMAVLKLPGATVAQYGLVHLVTQRCRPYFHIGVDSGKGRNDTFRVFGHHFGPSVFPCDQCVPIRVVNCV